MKKCIVLVITMVIAAVSLAGCKPVVTTTSGSDSSSASSETNFNETSTLNLDWASSVGTDSVFECPWVTASSLYQQMVFDTLVKIDTDGVTVVPNLAKSMEISADGKTYTFTLVENATWHDGEPCTADDVVWSYNTFVKIPDAGGKSALSSLVGYQDVADGKAVAITGLSAEGNKVIFTLSAPDNSIIVNAFAAIFILPKHLLYNLKDVALLPKYENYWKKPIGSGPYMIDEVSFPNYFSVVRNDNYFGVKPNIRKAVFTSHITGGSEAINADMIAGKLDYVYGASVNDKTASDNMVAQNSDLKAVVIPATYQRQFWFNNVGSTDGKYNSDVQKVAVRKAIDLILDRSAIETLYKGQAVALSTMVNPGLPAYNTSIPASEHNATKAKEMLTAAGFDFSRPIRLLYYYSDQTTADMMELLKQNFAEAGVTLEPFLASGDLGNIIYTVKNWEMMYCGAGASDPIICYNLLLPDGGSMDGLFGDVEFRKNTFVPLFDKYKATTDSAEMKSLGNQIQQASYDYAMILPIYGMNRISMYNSAKLKMPDSLFDMEPSTAMDMKFDQWELLQ